MALSWSPEFCRTRQRSGNHAAQCSGRNGRFGFIVHGLWPEGRSTWPQYCPTAQRPAPATVAKNICMMPSASLAARQWAKHGSCMTRKPATYFKVTNILWSSYRWPDFDRISREEGLTAGRIREAFASANPGWEPSMVGVKAQPPRLAGRTAPLLRETAQAEGVPEPDLRAERWREGKDLAGDVNGCFWGGKLPFCSTSR